MYQCGEVGSDGFHFTQARSVAAAETPLPNHSALIVRCGLSQA